MKKRVAIAVYGKQILATLSQVLTNVFGRGFGCATFNRDIQFARVFSDPAIVSTLSTQLSWSHFTELLPIKGQLSLLHSQERACEITGGAAR